MHEKKYYSKVTVKDFCINVNAIQDYRPLYFNDFRRFLMLFYFKDLKHLEAAICFLLLNDNLHAVKVNINIIIENYILKKKL